MLTTRVIPCLLLSGDGLVKTTGFRDPRYVGDPINAIKIFNEKEVDELIVLDILATRERRPPRLDAIGKMASECFMPLCYGGGVTSLSQVEALFNLGVEKVSISAAAVDNPPLVTQAAAVFGSQSVIVTVDVKQVAPNRYEVFTHGATRATGHDPVAFCRQVEQCGAGELVVNSIDRDGTMSGYDLDLLHQITSAVTIPVVAMGGAGTLTDFRDAVERGGASAVAAGNLFVFFGKHRAVLINYPARAKLESVLL